MDLFSAMQTVVKVAELGSFSQAAQALQLPNASVSARVARLEDRLGVKLFSRTTRQVRLTEEGAAYLEWAQRLLAEIGEVEDQLRGRHRKPRGRIRVDVPASAGRHVIAPALPDFLERYPDITVDLGCTDRPVDLVAEGVDCAIRGGGVVDEGLVARRLGTFQVITCAAPAYLARHGVPESPRALDGHRAVNFFSAKTGKVMPLEFQVDGHAETIDLKHQAGTNDADTYLALVEQGLGLAQFPLSGLTVRALAEGRLVEVLADWRPEGFPLFVVYARNRHLGARVRAFVDWSVELYTRIFGELAERRSRE